MLTLVVFILVLGILIFVHELGHFIMAKRNGIKVEEFAFGFPPRIFAIKRGETEYALNLLPFGGYVRMLGESETDLTDAEKKNPRSYARQSAWSRSKVVIAGVIMNFILGWLLITLGFIIGMAPVVTDPAEIPYATTQSAVVISGVGAGTAAETIGLKAGDLARQLNDVEITTKEKLAEQTKAHKGEEVILKITRGKQDLTLTGKLGSGEVPLGVQLADETKVKLPIWWAPIYAVWESIKAAGLIFVGVINLFKDILTTHHIPEEAAGPVGIFYVTKSVLQLGFGALLNFVAVLSINLGVINILPIPALDGGRLLFIVLETLNKGKKVINERIENIAHMIGFVLLILLIISITFNDIMTLVR